MIKKLLQDWLGITQLLVDKEVDEAFATRGDIILEESLPGETKIIPTPTTTLNKGYDRSK